jgi:hypothetical protein
MTDYERRPLNPDEDQEGPKSAEIVMSIGGKEHYPVVSGKCRTCNSNYIIKINNELMRGVSVPQILRGLPAGHGLSKDSIARHNRVHMPTEHQVRDALTQSRARERGIDVDNFIGSLLDADVTLRQFIQVGGEGLLTGAIKPDASQTLAAIRLLKEIEVTAGGGAITHATIAVVINELIRIMVGQLGLLTPRFTDAVLQGVYEGMRQSEIISAYLPPVPRRPVMTGVIEAQSRVMETEPGITVLDPVFASDDAPVVDSATSTPYPAEVVMDSAPASDFATSVLIRAEDVK